MVLRKTGTFKDKDVFEDPEAPSGILYFMTDNNQDFTYKNERDDMIDKPKRDRTNESYLYISPTHKEKLKQYTAKTKRTMRAEVELWVDGLKV